MLAPQSLDADPPPAVDEETLARAATAASDFKMTGARLAGFAPSTKKPGSVGGISDSQSRETVKETRTPFPVSAPT